MDDTKQAKDDTMETLNCPKGAMAVATRMVFAHRHGVSRASRPDVMNDVSRYHMIYRIRFQRDLIPEAREFVYPPKSKVSRRTEC